MSLHFQAPDLVTREKLDRLSKGASPRILDLFSGCGGLTTGFVRAGFESLGGIEIDPFAAATYALNFHREDYDHHSKPIDIRSADIGDVLRVPQHALSSAVDVIVGGPPCPSFTRIGRAKLREVMDHPEAYRLDERTSLYLSAIRVIEQTKPLAVLLENVPDVLNQGGRSVGDEIAEQLSGIGYEVSYALLNAANYGVPQTRDRFFLMAYASELGIRPTFPNPTHWLDIPRGYASSRNVALKLISDPKDHPYYLPPSEATPDLPPAVTTSEAIGDLPKVTERLPRGARRLNSPTLTPSCDTTSKYAREIRTWPQFMNKGFVLDHVTRSLGERDLRIFAAMSAGDQYPQAHALAVKFWNEAGGHDEQLREYVPPYDPSKFPNKWRKLEPDRPSRTLMAHLGKDTYSHIHYDSAQARTITVREAARLQSFPDGFEFFGTMNPAFRQIGNAVAPLLAFRLAESLLSGLMIKASSLHKWQPSIDISLSRRQAFSGIVS
ncbi:DNA (cytosine-5)-methyltransferase 1 [Paenarthrobacter nicotinovorans]|uniref:DNA (cytosine-5-)-methyltransferase n=1 Tax=Paenarthrobacter nicotinovorans TaxID=29320 RepID=A0ABT9TR69_PAENI|nr:DNA cytosine methyltransferase [Paenarthrobacter nicotinovorans]MDQ0103363.1 DNA (cytosine-5)-methyltransferase 1 [Paenarthrobacter nicotinovorans]